MANTISYGLRRYSPQASAVSGRSISLPTLSGLSVRRPATEQQQAAQAPVAPIDGSYDAGPAQGFYQVPEEPTAGQYQGDVGGRNMPGPAGAPESPVTSAAKEMAGLGRSTGINLANTMSGLDPAKTTAALADAVSKTSNAAYASDRLSGILGRSEVTSGLVNQNNLGGLFGIGQRDAKTSGPGEDMQGAALEMSDPTSFQDVSDLSRAMGAVRPSGKSLDAILGLAMPGSIAIKTGLARLSGNFTDPYGDTIGTRQTGWTDREMMDDTTPEPTTGQPRGPAQAINAMNTVNNALDKARAGVRAPAVKGAFDGPFEGAGGGWAEGRSPEGLQAEMNAIADPQMSSPYNPQMGDYDLPGILGIDIGGGSDPGGYSGNPAGTTGAGGYANMGDMAGGWGTGAAFGDRGAGGGFGGADTGDGADW